MLNDLQRYASRPIIISIGLLTQVILKSLGFFVLVELCLLAFWCSAWIYARVHPVAGLIMAVIFALSLLRSCTRRPQFGRTLFAYGLTAVLLFVTTLLIAIFYFGVICALGQIHYSLGLAYLFWGVIYPFRLIDRYGLRRLRATVIWLAPTQPCYLAIFRGAPR